METLLEAAAKASSRQSSHPVSGVKARTAVPVARGAAL